MKYSKYLLKSFVMFLAFSTLSTYAADIVVNGSGLIGTYTTISAGINAASPGDRVLVELSPYDLTRGRITYRFK